MSNILESATVNDQYFGMIRINLIKYWGMKWNGYSMLDPGTYVEYKEMRQFLADSQTKHKFEWINTGLYLPDYLWIEKSDTATAFMLKYDV
jgi:hypothetical protein